jgi:hypothetical protein
MRLLITIFFLILKISFTFSQTPKIDSLKKLIAQQQVAGSVDAATLFELCGQYASLHPDTLKFYASLAESVAVSQTIKIILPMQIILRLYCYQRMVKRKMLYCRLNTFYMIQLG